jgi:plastocyanin
VAVGTPGFRYEPAAVILRPGERVVLVLRNTDTRAHNLTVDRLNIQMTANAGETVRLPLEAPPAGSFVMYCSLGGHLRAGHRGRLEVR